MEDQIDSFLCATFLSTFPAKIYKLEHYNAAKDAQQPARVFHRVITLNELSQRLSAQERAGLGQQAQILLEQ